MCCPLVSASLGERAHIKSTGIWLYNLGRFVSYSGAGLILGGLSESLLHFLPQISKILAMLLGTALILFAIYHPFKAKWNFPTALKPKPWAQNLARRAMNLPTHFRDFGLGLVTVALPCMTLSPALLLAAGSQSTLQGFGIMLAFYLGTLPAMLSATSVPLLISRHLPAWINRWGVAAFLLIAGTITLFRAYGHQH